jgi:serine-type D-Ala-D-Ala carboxypeptidase/endopeptidase (penicillin-binding protein 4)
VSEGDTGHVPASHRSPGARRRDGRLLRRSTAGLVALVLALAGATYQFDLGARWFGLGAPPPVVEPAQVLPPAGLKLPAAPRAAPVAAERVDRPVDAAAVRRAVTPLVRSPKLGSHVVLDVAEMLDGKIVYRHGTGAVAPASTMKMLTTVAALEALGPGHRFITSVVATPQSKRIVLVGGGDPLLGRTRAAAGTYPARADLATLADATARSLKALGRSKVTLGYDTSLFRGPSVDPQWEPTYIPENVISPISPLWVNEGREKNGLADRSASPPFAAATDFADALRKRHITVLGEPVPARAPSAAHGGRPIAAVHSAPLAEVVQHILEVSDNEGAEVLSHQVAVAEKRPATFAGGARAVRSVLARIGVSTTGDQIYDGSGLSRHDRLRPETLLSVIRTSTSHRYPNLHTAVANLPVAGFTGSLASRFRTGKHAGLGMVRAKTGTLTGVHGLTGTVTSRDGAVMSFVAIADRVDPVNSLDAQDLVDRLAAALAGCGCAG